MLQVMALSHNQLQRFQATVETECNVISVTRVSAKGLVHDVKSRGEKGKRRKKSLIKRDLELKRRRRL